MDLASSTAATPKSTRPWARYTTRATAARCFVASSALTSGRSLRFPSFSMVAHSGVEILRQFSIPNSRNNERTCLRSGRTLRPFSTHSSVLPRLDSFLLHVVIVSHQQCLQFMNFNNCFFSHIRSSRTDVHSKSSTCTQRRMSRVSC